MSTIHLYIADNIVNNVIDDDSIVVIWDKLKKLYLAKSLTNKLYIKQKLYKLRIEEGENLVEHLYIFKGIFNPMKKVDMKIDKECCFLHYSLIPRATL